MNNPIRTEPALTAGIAGAVAALLGVLLVYRIVDEQQAAAWGALAAAVIPLAVGVWTRSRVFSPDTLREAGLNPAEVERDANDPAVRRNRRGEQ